MPPSARQTKAKSATEKWVAPVDASAAKAQLESFLEKFSPEIAKQATAILREMRRRYPTALELVYDNYNALAIGFGPTERASDAIFSIALYPKWVSLFFLQGASLPDAKKMLKGSGKVVKHIVLTSPAMLNDADLRDLMRLAVERASAPFPEEGKHRIVIKAVSKKQRPRRPAPAGKRSR